MGYFTVYVGVVEGLVPSKLAGVELGCVIKRQIMLIKVYIQNYQRIVQVRFSFKH